MASQQTIDRGMLRKLKTYFISKPANCGANVYLSENQSIPSGAWTAIDFDTEREDTGWITDDGGTTRGFWRDDGNANWQRKLFAQKAGNHIITGHIQFAAAAGGIRGIGIRLGAATYIAYHTQLSCGANSPTDLSIARKYWMEVGEYVNLRVYQDTGAPINVIYGGNFSPEFAIVRIP